MQVDRSQRLIILAGEAHAADARAPPRAAGVLRETGPRAGGQGCVARTTRCAFHGGSDSMRVNVRSAAFACMAGCGARGGDVFAYHMAAQGLGFVEAAGPWGPGRKSRSTRPPRVGRRAGP